MKTGLTTSVILHAALIVFGLFTLAAPRPYEAGDVEALPVDIIPVQSITQVQKGDKKAPKKEKSAPKPTTRPDIVADAKEVGDNKVDMKPPPTPDARPKPVAAAAAPPKSPEPVAKPVEKAKPEPQKEAASKPEPVPATEVTPEAQPKQDVKPDPVQKTIVAENPDAQSAKLPNSAPAPDARPKPPQAQTAKAPERKDSNKPAVQQAARPKSEEKDDTLDKVAALLNKEKASGGGAKRSTQEASLGADHTTGGSKLSQSEMDALRGQIEKCWNVPAGVEDAGDLKVSVKFKLDRSGSIEGSPEIVSGGGGGGIGQVAAESARRAVLRCAPYTLPADKYDAWADVIVNFDPSDMF